ncbi:acyl-CoA thioesterase [Actinomadura sp. WAC 06369]|uniref:acyl-CoA thioesterase n=1 Tax=Actinomadura sp. WAC 06369 TaxID=2203193 RepID=UPI0018F441D1|nr:acyl-CoA thioesterase domain-containing protein [Actinomadura sp. WAC 06369]
MPTSVTDPWSDLLACLELDGPGPVPGGGSGAAAASPAAVRLTGRNQRLTYHRLFGGQLLAQFVRAAGAVCPGKAVKSLHALFPRAGRSDEPVRYEVERHHEGGTFATVAVTARQEPGVIATASVSLHAGEDGADRQSVPGVPAVPGAEHEVKLGLLPWETRSTADLDAAAAGPPEYELWMRTPAVGAELAPALAAYATDLTLIGTALRPLDGVSQSDAGTAFTSAVTSHSVWFHRPFRTDDWLLLRQHSPVLAHGRCFGRGDLLAADGSLVASYAQEALLRLKDHS